MLLGYARRHWKAPVPDGRFQTVPQLIAKNLGTRSGGRQGGAAAATGAAAQPLPRGQQENFSHKLRCMPGGLVACR